MLLRNLLRIVPKSVPRRHYSVKGCKVAGLHEPEYLEQLKPKIGYYDLLNVQLRGHDFVVLEKYQSYLHKTMKKLNMKVTRAWSTPHQEMQYDLLVDQSSAIATSYVVKMYQRNLQTSTALVTQLSLLIDIIQATTPPGVSFSIDYHSEADDNKIYFKDSILENFRNELQELKDTPLIGV